MWLIFVKFLTLLLSKLFFPIKARGEGHIPRNGGFILASNHLSNIDPFVVGLAAQPRWLAYMAKDSLFKNKILAHVLSQWGAFPVKREKLDISVMKEALKRLKDGYGVLIFPEGTRKKEEKVGEFLPGAGFLTVKSGLPIIPTYIQGTDRVLPPGGRFLRRSPVSVSFGPPVLSLQGESYEQVTSRVMRSVAELIDSA